MSQFEEFNVENKLRVPLSAYAAYLIESDCVNFSLKRTTIINRIILNYYSEAECSISIRINHYRQELMNHFAIIKSSETDALIEKLLTAKTNELKAKYVKRQNSDFSWPITINTKVKKLLTSDANTCEEKYYAKKPGHYVRALIEDYAQLPFYKRERIIFKNIFENTNEAINRKAVISYTNTSGKTLSIKPYKIELDPLSMYHYIIGYSASPNIDGQEAKVPHALGLRLSRIVDADVQFYLDGEISKSEELRLQNEIKEKGVQFMYGDSVQIKLWLSDAGIQRYNSQIHLRPAGTPDEEDEHVYNFTCTETQIIYYFLSFGKDVKILSPASLADRFINEYKQALDNYRLLI